MILRKPSVSLHTGAAATPDQWSFLSTVTLLKPSAFCRALLFLPGHGVEEAEGSSSGPISADAWANHLLPLVLCRAWWNLLSLCEHKVQDEFFLILVFYKSHLRSFISCSLLKLILSFNSVSRFFFSLNILSWPFPFGFHIFKMNQDLVTPNENMCFHKGIESTSTAVGPPFPSPSSVSELAFREG